MSTTSASPSKRGRAPSSSGGQVASCLVDGCNADLSKCRDYHRKHKVCEVHSKTPKVTVGGHEQRFCQQCSRFHSLGEFDEGKRSCRKRLEGHNRRRRKPHPESLPFNPGSFLSAGQGSRFLPFSGSVVIHPSSGVSSTWSGTVKPEMAPPLYGTSRVQSISAPYSNSSRGKQLPFLQGPDSPELPGSSSSAHQLLHDLGSVGIATCFRGSNSSSSISHLSSKIFCNGQSQPVISDTDRALSLLSSSPPPPPIVAAAAATATDAHGLGFNRMMHQANDPTGSPRPLVSSLHYGSVAHYHAGPHRLEGVGGGSSSLRFPDVFQGNNNNNNHEGSPAIGPHETLSFSWE